MRSSRKILEGMFDADFPPTDLKIVTSTRTFNVHKDVVCKACPFFEAACRNDWKEAQEGVINVPEDEATMSELLKHCYGTRYSLTRCAYSAGWLQYLSTLIAAKKYQLNTLSDRVQDFILKDYRGVDCVEIGVWIYQEDRRQALPSAFVRQVVIYIAFQMKEILELPSGEWEMLQKSPELLKDVMRMVARRSEAVFEEDGVGWTEPDYLQKEETAETSQGEKTS